ncbi:MAG: MFS family permease [Acidimicrobiales bacterium]|jgi:MFS family permease
MTAAGPRLDSGRSWLMATAAAVSMFTVFGVGYSFGAFFESITTEFDTGNGATAFVFGITISLSFLLGPFTGALADRVGPKPVAVLAAFSLAFGLLGTTVVPNIWLAYICYGLFVGFAIACGYVPMVAVVGGWFEHQRALALGASVAGIGLGTMVASPVAAALIEATSWRTAFVIFAVVGGGSLLAVASVITPGPASVPAPKRQPITELWKLHDFRILYLALLATSFGLFIPFVFITPYAEDQSHSSFAAALLVGLIGGASVVGRLAIGGIANRYGAARLFRICFLVMSMSQLIWLFAGGGYPLLLVFALIFGSGYGGFIALSPVVAASRFGMKGLGGILGTWYSAAAFGSLGGPPFAGWLIDTFDYPVAIVFCSFAAVVGWAILLRLDEGLKKA